MGGGNVQEEIRFCISPELIVARLFVDQMSDSECILIQGCQQYSSYSGYGGTFKFLDNFQDKTNDIWVLAIDALNLFEKKGPQFQFKTEFVLRELAKLYIGFAGSKILQSYEEENKCKKSIATGNWGCGMFAGNHQLKFVLQWLAASVTGRELIYSTFNEKQLVNVEKVVEIYKSQTVAQLATNLWKFMKQRYEPPINFKFSLFDFFQQQQNEI